MRLNETIKPTIHLKAKANETQKSFTMLKLLLIAEKDITIGKTIPVKKAFVALKKEFTRISLSK